MSDYDLTPMEPVPWPEPFDGQGWLFQVKWDGVRILAVHDDGRIGLINRKGHSRTEQYPELGVLCDWIPAGTVLDGEVVAFANGKPSFHCVMQRDSSRRKNVITAKQVELPITYFIFDVLYHQGRDIRALPLLERQRILLDFWPGNQGPPHLVESFPSGIQLFAAVQQQGLEGIVAKELASSYVPGKRSAAWRKIKFFREIYCLVGGYTLRQGLFSALLLGLRNGQQLNYVGAAGSGISQQDWRALRPLLKAAEIPHSPFSTRPIVRDREIHWVQPLLAARVKFMEWSSDLKLRAPVVIGFEAASNVKCSYSEQGV